MAKQTSGRDGNGRELICSFCGRSQNEVEQILKRHNIYYTKNEVWIASEKMYEVLYEMEV